MKSKNKTSVPASKSPQGRRPVNCDRKNIENDETKIVKPVRGPDRPLLSKQFELFYKVKNTGRNSNHYEEESYESLILLKSKNKVKKLSTKAVKEKQTHCGQFSLGPTVSMDFRDVPLRYKQDDPKASNRNVANKKSPNQHKKKTKKGLPSAGSSHVQKTLKKCKSQEFQQKHYSQVRQPKIQPQKTRVIVSKSPRSNNPQQKVKSKSSSKPPIQLKSKRIQQLQPAQDNQYILFGNEIINSTMVPEIDCQISNLMARNQPKQINLIQADEKEDNDQDFYTIKQYYDEKATLIQKMWRGYRTRKMLRKQKQIKINSRRLDPDDQHSDQQRQLREAVISNSQNLKNNAPTTTPSIDDRLKNMMTEIDLLQNKQEKDQLYRKLKNFLRQKQLSTMKSEEGEIPGDDVSETLQIRQNAIELRLSTQISILKKLLESEQLEEGEYDRRLIEVEKWAYHEKEEIQRLRQLLKNNLIRAAEIVKKTHQNIILVEKVRTGQEQQIVLQKILDDIPKPDNDNYFFYPEEERQKASGCHSFPVQGKKKCNIYLKTQDETNETKEQHENPYNTSLKHIVEELKQRQKVKNEIDRRVAILMAYYKPTLPKGTINTSIQGVHTFLTNFFRFVNYYYKHEFLRFINMPYGYSPERRIKLMQGYECQSFDEEDLDGGMVQGIQSVINPEIFQEYMQHYEEQKAKQSDTKAMEFELIHNRAIFDAFNESLNLFRPYFLIKGPPYLWNTSEKALTFYFIAEQNMDQVFQKTKYKVLKYCSALCGLQIPQYEGPPIKSLDEMLLMKSNCHKVLAECRQQRLLKSQRNYTHQADYEWFLTEEQRTQSMIELSQLLFMDLIRDVAAQLTGINICRQFKI